jgi:hypothetical protein
MIANLSKPEYVHVLLNPLPIYGLGVAVVGLIIALLWRSRAARITALALVMLSAASAWLVYYYWEAGYDRVKATVDEAGDKWLDEHMRRGEQYLRLLSYRCAVCCLLWQLSQSLRCQKQSFRLAIATLILAVANLSIGGYIAYPGGHVRHKEFSFEAQPEPQ